MKPESQPRVAPGLPARSSRREAASRVARKSGQLRSFVNLVAKPLAVAAMTLLLLPAAQAKHKPEDFTQVYTHTYDEVFQGVQQMCERAGMFVTSTDTDKGIIIGKGHFPPYSCLAQFEVHIESISAKPETRVTLVFKPNNRCYKPLFADRFFSELQKVLATY